MPAALDMCQSTDVMAAAAIELVRDKRSVIPIRFKSKFPAIASWAEFQRHKPSFKNVHAWFEHSYKNLGIVTGKVSNLVVFDIDNQKMFLKLQSLYDQPQGPEVITPNGVHWYYEWPGFTIPNSANRVDGVDFRGDGGYVVAPPSIGEDGTRYRWTRSLFNHRLGPVPYWLYDFFPKLKEAKEAHDLKLPYKRR